STSPAETSPARSPLPSAIATALVHALLLAASAYWWASGSTDHFVNVYARFNARMPAEAQRGVSFWKVVENQPLVAARLVLVAMLIDFAMLYGLSRLEPWRVLRELWAGGVSALAVFFLLFSAHAMLMPAQALMAGSSSTGISYSDASREEPKKLYGAWRP